MPCCGFWVNDCTNNKTNAARNPQKCHFKACTATSVEYFLHCSYSISSVSHKLIWDWFNAMLQSCQTSELVELCSQSYCHNCVIHTTSNWNSMLTETQHTSLGGLVSSRHLVTYKRVIFKCAESVGLNHILKLHLVDHTGKTTAPLWPLWLLKEMPMRTPSNLVQGKNHEEHLLSCISSVIHKPLQMPFWPSHITQTSFLLNGERTMQC